MSNYNYNIPKNLDDNGKYAYLYLEFLDDDKITGNASLSYTNSEYEASKNLVGNFDLLKDALKDYGYDSFPIDELNPEFLDVAIRCHLLSQALIELINDGRI